MFALYGRQFRLCDDNGNDIVVTSSSLNGKSVYVCRPEDKIPIRITENGPFSKFINMEKSGKKGTVLLENPLGKRLFKTETDAKKFEESLL